MNRFYVFFIRAVLGLVFGVLISRAFFGAISPAHVAGIAVFIVGMAYVKEYFRIRKQNRKGDLLP